MSPSPPLTLPRGFSLEQVAISQQHFLTVWHHGNRLWKQHSHANLSLCTEKWRQRVHLLARILYKVLYKAHKVKGIALALSLALSLLCVCKSFSIFLFFVILYLVASLFNHYMLIKCLYVAPLKPPVNAKWLQTPPATGPKYISIVCQQGSDLSLVSDRQLDWAAAAGWCMKEKAAAKNWGHIQCATGVFAKCKRATLFHMWKHRHSFKLPPSTII